MTHVIGTIASSRPVVTGKFESIATVTGNGTVATYTFSSIPATYQHLQIRISALKSAVTAEELRLRLNGDTGTNYVRRYISGYNLTPSESSATGQTYIQLANNVTGNADMSTTYPTIAITDIHDYASTTKNKTIRGVGGIDQNTATNSEIDLISGLWLNTSAINSVTVFMHQVGANFAAGTTIALYGIKGA
jgi:hypothetical protein